MQFHPADTRGRTRLGWLDSAHAFSFGHWYDPTRMGVGPLRVLNDDRVKGGAGFGAHPHQDMEIVSYVLEGALAHRDSHGHEGVIHAGEVQFMRAGTGVVHSEKNASPTEPVRFLQVWFQPRSKGAEPTYQQEKVTLADNVWTTLASPDEGARIDADARMRAARLTAGGAVEHTAAEGRAAYVYVVEGGVAAEGRQLVEGDAALMGAGEAARFVAGAQGARLVLFDVSA